MPRFDEMPEYRARLSRTTHDLSHTLKFTATVAHLMPVFHDFLQPGETVDLSVAYNLRTQPLQSAAMVDIKSHVEYFFVPAFLLYEPIGSMFYDLNDNFSSNYPNSSSSSNIQAKFPVLDFNDVLNSLRTQYGTLVGTESWHNHVYRLFDLLGYNNYKMRDDPVNLASFNPNVFPYPILAYNCIYEYYYRLDTRERFDQYRFNWDKFYNTPLVGTTDYYFKNIRLYYRPKESDYFTDVKVSPIVDVLNLNVKDSLSLADSWLSRTQFTNKSVKTVDVLSSGSPGVNGGQNTANTSGLDTTNTPLSDIQTNFGFSFSSKNPDIPVNGMDINTANIRAMFANEKLWSITGRAKKHYDDQVLAHLGYKVPHDVKHEISCFGHDRGQVHIGEVISTADTQNAGLGEIAGKGYGSLQPKSHKFTAPCHGVIMAILSFVPDVCYSNTYQKCNAVVDRNSFYNPEFDSLGMQPLFGYEGHITWPTGRNNIVGWQYRYEQWKRRFNRVSKAFSSNGSLDSWALDFSAPAGVSSSNTESYSEYLYNPNMLDDIMLVPYHNGHQYVSDESEFYDGDPFIIECYINCKKVSTMSDFSLPRLDA